MIVVGDRFRRKSDGSLWEVAGFLYEAVKPGERVMRKAVLGPMDDPTGPKAILLEDLENEVGWRRE